MSGLQVVIASLLGLSFGSFANVVAHRVPTRSSLLLPSRCPACGTGITAAQNIPVLSWLLLRGRCSSCEAPISPLYPLVEATNGIVFAVLAWWVPTVLGLSGPAGVLVWAAFSSFCLFSSVLIVIDFRTRRLPDVVVFSGFAVSLVLLTLACLFGADWAPLVRALAGMAAMYAVYWLIRLVRPDGMGGGDVKLAGLAGLHLGFLGWGALAVGWLAAFVLGTCFVAGLALRGGVTRRSTFAFGPWLLAGAWIGVWFGNSIWSSYTALSGLVFAKG